MPAKYAPLEKYLTDVPKSAREVRLTFAQIEKILNSKLPSSAYEDERWWMHETEGNHRNTRSWSNAGWRVESLDVGKKWVKFVRADGYFGAGRAAPACFARGLRARADGRFAIHVTGGGLFESLVREIFANTSME